MNNRYHKKIETLYNCNPTQEKYLSQNYGIFLMCFQNAPFTIFKYDKESVVSVVMFSNVFWKTFGSSKNVFMLKFIGIILPL